MFWGIFYHFLEILKLKVQRMAQKRKHFKVFSKRNSVVELVKALQPTVQ
jgi:hypothetical protein